MARLQSQPSLITHEGPPHTHSCRQPHHYRHTVLPTFHQLLNCRIRHGGRNTRPFPTSYSIDILCERFHAIELHKELRTRGTSEDPAALLVKQKGSRGSGRSEPEHRGGIGESSGNSSSSSKGKRANVICNGCGKKGYYKHECRAPKRQEKGGQSQNTATVKRARWERPHQQGEPSKACRRVPSFALWS